MKHLLTIFAVFYGCPDVNLVLIGFRFMPSRCNESQLPIFYSIWLLFDLVRTCTGLRFLNIQNCFKHFTKYHDTDFHDVCSDFMSLN